MIKELGKNVHKNLIFLLFFLFSVWILVPFSEGMNSGGGWGLAWFIVLYFQGTYLRLYYIPGGKMKKKILAVVISLCTICISKFGMELLAIITGIEYFKVYAGWCFRYDSVSVFLASVATFIVILNVNIKSEKLQRIILKIAPLMFPVYMIHNHAHLYPLIWCLLAPENYIYDKSFIFYMFVCAILVWSSSVILACPIFVLSNWIKKKIGDKMAQGIEMMGSVFYSLINFIWKLIYDDKG